MQTLQLFTEIMKTESICKSHYNAKLEGLVQRHRGQLKVEASASTLEETVP
jgi:hypothetical protein